MSKEPRGITHSWEKRIAVVTKYIALGNLRLVSEVENIPYPTLIYWKNNEPWWPQLIDEVKKARSAKTGDKISKLVDGTLDLIQDRLENGDWILNQKTGEVERKPVSLRDVNTVANNLMTQQIKLEEVTTRIETHKESVQDTLKMLAIEFAKWTGNKPKEQVQDIEYVETVNAIHEEREEGLQEGGSSVHLETGSGEEENPAERSTP